MTTPNVTSHCQMRGGRQIDCSWFLYTETSYKPILIIIIIIIISSYSPHNHAPACSCPQRQEKRTSSVQDPRLALTVQRDRASTTLSKKTLLEGILFPDGWRLVHRETRSAGLGDLRDSSLSQHCCCRPWGFPWGTVCTEFPLG